MKRGREERASLRSSGKVHGSPSTTRRTGSCIPSIALESQCCTASRQAIRYRLRLTFPRHCSFQHGAHRDES
jgi:hypothetical protein